MRRSSLLLLVSSVAFGQTPVGTVNRPSYLHNVHGSNLTWQTRATAFASWLTKTGVVVHWDFGDGSTANSNTPAKTYPTTALKTFQMVAKDGWGGLTVLDLNNQSLRGGIPSLARATGLVELYVHGNQLTGSIPSLGSNPALTHLYVVDNQLTGSIPNLDANVALVRIYAHNNQFTGAIPSLATNTALTKFYGSNNQLTSYTGGLGTRVLDTFKFNVNALTVIAVNAILADLKVAQVGGNPVCTVDLSGGTNATPTGQGLLDKAFLIAAGWTVQTN